MSLIDRYLEAVAGQLPAASRDDIVAELRGLIAERVDAREAETGRAPTEAEVEAVLRDLGHPLVVAARYRDEPQHVVGPALYPFWLAGMKVAALMLLVITGIGLVVRIAGGEEPGQAFGHATGGLFNGAIMIVGFATVAAWLIEREGKRVPFIDNWRVKDLGWLELARWDLGGWTRRRARTPGRGLSVLNVRRQEGFFTAVSTAIVLLWWTGVWRIGADVLSGPSRLGGAWSAIDWGSVHAAVYLPVIALLSLTVVQGLTRLVWPGRVRVSALLRLACDAVWLWILAWGFGVVGQGSPFAAMVRVSSVQALIDRARHLADHTGGFDFAALMTVMIWGAAVFTVLDAIVRLWQVATGREGRGPVAD